MGETPYYEDRFVKLYCGDCRELLKQIPTSRVDAIYSDAPYTAAAATSTTGRSHMKHGGNWGDMSLLKLMCEATLDPLKGGRQHVLWWATDQHGIAALMPVLYRRYPVVQLLTWDKDTMGMGCGYRRQTEFFIHCRTPGAPQFTSKRERDIIRMRPGSRVTEHPTERPQSFMAKVLRPIEWTTVLDPYAGSGTTLLVARALGRRAIGIEIEERFCEMAAKRLSQAHLSFGGDTERKPSLAYEQSEFGFEGTGGR